MSEAQLENERAGSQWRGHRLAALALRVLVFLFPVSVAVALGLLVSRSLPGHPLGLMILRVAVTAAVSVFAFISVERLARRFLPLAALLRLNLVFPDRAPSRFSVALRSTSVRKLQQWVREARETDDTAALAGKVVTLASALNTHDRRTRGHCERTRALADLIVEELHLSPAEANEVRWGAFLHDIGKLAVPPEILNKPGKPTDHEWEVLRSHPEAGARLVAPLRGFLHSGVDAVGSHHENFDGSGYPNGLAGEELPLAARIVSVADSFEVMTAVRAYKRPMSLQAARAELARKSGTQFDPQVVRAFLNVSLGRVHWTLGLAAWMAELPFLTVLPRVAAQLVTATGAAPLVPPVTLSSVAAASLGAMAVIAPLQAPSHSHTHPSSRPASARPASASPVTRSDVSSGAAPPSAATAASGSGTDVTVSAVPAPVRPVVDELGNQSTAVVATAVSDPAPLVAHAAADVSSSVDPVVPTLDDAVDGVRSTALTGVATAVVPVVDVPPAPPALLSTVTDVAVDAGVDATDTVLHDDASTGVPAI